MNVFDSVIRYVDPVRALSRAQARKVLAVYEGAKPSPYRKSHRDNRSPNALVGASAAALRAHARHLERNHDISRGALRVLVNNVIGATGIQVEPQPRRRDGTIHKEYAQALRDARRQWEKRPEVTGRFAWPLAQRIMAYTWLRDGEVFAQRLIGDVPFLRHGSSVPYSLELMEPDFIPLDFDDKARQIQQGIQINAWGRPSAFYAFKRDPRDALSIPSAADLKAIPAERMLHVATFDRLHQLRGVSEFASVLTRIEDLKDYEESERVAAKVAANLTGYVKRNSPEYQAPADAQMGPDGLPLPRDLRLAAGTIIDSLAVGEEIGLIDSNRPNPNLVGWRTGQLRAFASGVGASHSSISKDYDGSYSAMRQELVESWVHYAVLTDEFASMCVQPAHEDLVMAGHLSGAVPIPPDVVPSTAADCLLLGQSMPWIDPLKEALAYEKLGRAGYMSEVEIIRRRGGNPRDTLDQITEYRKEVAERGLQFSSDASNDSKSGGSTQDAAVGEKNAED